jgi:internalin A
MASAGNANRVVLAIRYLHDIHEFYEFDSKERVVKVCVYNAPHGDEIAAHLGNLVDLRELLVESADLTDAGLRHLRSLVKLKKLWLKAPLVTGDGLASLTRMKRLQELILFEVQLDPRGFEHLSKLKNLVELSVSGGSYRDQDMTSLAALTRLKELRLTANDNIDGTFAACLVDLPQLRRLSTSVHENAENVTDAGLASIAKLSALEDLSVDGQFTDAQLCKVSQLKKLQVLAIGSKCVTCAGVTVVAGLPALKRLHLATPLLTDDSVPSLVQCTSLEYLRLRSSAITDKGLQQLRDLMPKCDVSDKERDRWPDHCRNDPQGADRQRR